MNKIRAYWVTCGWRNGNAGDEYTRDVIHHYSGLPVEQTAEPNDSNMVSCGSIAEHLDHLYGGAVWGIGMMFEHRRRFTPSARLCALRGKLTAARWESCRDVAIGDPGLLAGEVYEIPAKRRDPRYTVGVIPHYVDGQNQEIREFSTRWPDLVTVIDICAKPRDLVRAISECHCVVSSSLHGLIFADAIGVPNAWTTYSENEIQGGSFKFRDYYSAFGINDPKAIFVDPKTNPRDVYNRVSGGYARNFIDEVKANLRASFPFPKK